MEDTLSDHNYVSQVTKFIERKKRNWEEHVDRIPEKKDLKILSKRRKKFGKQWKDFVL